MNLAERPANRRLPNETQRDFLIRTGKITPFAKLPAENNVHVSGDLADAILDAENEIDIDQIAEDSGPRSHQNLHRPGFREELEGEDSSTASESSLRPRKRRRIQTRDEVEGESTVTPSSTDLEVVASDYTDEDASRSPAKKRKDKNDRIINLDGIDDGNEEVYQSRLESWTKKRSRARQNRSKDETSVDANGDRVDAPAASGEEEWLLPSPDTPDHSFDNGLKLPGDIYPYLFDYQKTGVQWLGELYTNQVGGIVGDEMGLGKTIQIIAFIAALHYSKKLTKPVIVVAPATVLRQWVNEFHTWWPPLRVSILHTSGSGMLNVRNERAIEDYEEVFRDGVSKKPSKQHKLAKGVVDRVVKKGHVLVTTYAGLQTYSDLLVNVDWDYAVLDEGHKIRNPNTAITYYCKQLRTANRVILSGTPIQNNLIELWSLFDFVYPMRLGTLVAFREQFEIPIKLAGYANATNLQIMTAEKCAVMLRDAISPYFLHRIKADVAADLPEKTEQILFCKLTKPQREAYELFLASEEMTSILNRTRQSLYGIDILRKTCNHPDLLDPRTRNKPGYKWGNPNKSGKMQVVKVLLGLWRKNGDKALLFSQGVQMLDIIEEMVKNMGDINYLRMDGSTNVKDRQTMVDRFNNDPNLHVFLLTTRVGGLGVNLTGANRVIIFDPDWNPSTDIQARERAWRLGQKKQVAIYRLMTKGTIEEKIYQRQIYKQYLTDKVLKDPTQRQSFHIKDLFDLFTLGSSEGQTETGDMFEGAERQLPASDRRDSIIEEDAENHFDTSTAIRRPGADGIPQWRDKSAPTAKTETGDPAPTFAHPDWGAGDIVKLENQPDDDVSKIVGVAHVEEYHGNASEEKPSTSESRLLEGIFARSGVSSVLEHDAIVNPNKPQRVTADRAMLEREARRVAAEAAAELRRAGEQARHVPIGTVTWTGEIGEAGRPENVRRRGGPSSAGILSGLAQRQGLSSPQTGSGTSSPARAGTPGSGDRTPVRGKDFIKLIPEYIRRQGGSVPSQMLVVHFNPMCKSQRQIEEFKAMLEQVATLKKSTARGKGRWELKDEYK
jgi:DNA excision repair protein ERCC-6